MNFFQIIFKHGIFARLLVLPAIAFILCLVIHLAVDQGKFVELVRGWKGWTIYSVAAIMLSSALELKTAFEDYIPDERNRSTAIKCMIGVAVVSVAIIAITIGQM